MTGQQAQLSDGHENGSGPDFEIDWDAANDARRFREGNPNGRGYYAKTRLLLQNVVNILARDGALDGDDPETNRQVHYQLVQAGLIENTDRKYDDLCDAIKSARLDGIIPFYAIEDRTRYLRERETFESIGQALQTAVNRFEHDIWRTQTERFEVFVEKDALIGTIAKACDPCRLSYLSTRGYISLSTAREAADRFHRVCQEAAERFEYSAGSGQIVTVLHLADHDPSGVDMTRDLRERLDYFGAPYRLERIGLNPEQIDALNPVPNYAKLTDTRTRAYWEMFPDYRDGNRVMCWELDAMPRKMLIDTIQQRIERDIDVDAWNEAIERETEGRERMQSFVDGWGGE